MVTRVLKNFYFGWSLTPQKKKHISVGVFGVYQVKLLIDKNKSFFFH